MSAFLHSPLALYLSKFLILLAALWNCKAHMEGQGTLQAPSTSASPGTSSDAAEDAALVLGCLALDPALATALDLGMANQRSSSVQGELGNGNALVCNGSSLDFSKKGGQVLLKNVF